MPMPGLPLARIASSAGMVRMSSSCSGRVQVGARQVDLVDDRDDPQLLGERQVGVGHRLRLDALRRVDQEQRPSQAASERETS
jgi:tRNA(Phe) wybutosine-synthesizing methylase Tyw3